MSDTTNLKLPLILPSQAQKHVTHNEALQRLDALVHLTVLSRAISSAPDAPVAGGRYIIAENGQGSWQDHELEIASYENGAWQFYQPNNGWLVWVSDENQLVVWTGENWEPVTSNSQLDNFNQLGINTTADETNKLAVKSDSVLFSHDDNTGGNGSIRQVLNKQTAPDTSSIIFQSNFSGRAEIGNLGNDDLTLKVSPNGSSWNDALVIDSASALVEFPKMSNGPRPVYTYHSNSVSNVNNWYSVFEWELDGNYRVVSAILDITHRNELRHHELRILFEFSENTGTPTFTRALMQAFGDDFTNGDKFKLVANHQTQKCTLYTTRSSGHYPIRYMSFRQHEFDEGSTNFIKVNRNVGTVEPMGDLGVLVE